MKPRINTNYLCFCGERKIMEYKNIKYQLSDNVARITLNHLPLNILNIEMMKEINKVLDGLLEEKNLKLLLMLIKLYN